MIVSGYPTKRIKKVIRVYSGRWQPYFRRKSCGGLVITIILCTINGLGARAHSFPVGGRGRLFLGWRVYDGDNEDDLVAIRTYKVN